MNIYNKLNLARTKFHTQKMKKSGRNDFAKYNYFELGDFLLPIMTILDECGLCGIVSFDKELATLKLIDLDDTTQQIIITSPFGSAALKGCHEVQNIGAVETYQRRYLWMAAFEIVEHDALDATTGSPEQVIAKTLLTENQIADFSLLISNAETEDELKSSYKGAYRLAQGQEDTKALNTFTTLYNARKTVLGVK